MSVTGPALVMDRASQCDGKEPFANPTLAWRVWARKRRRRHAPKAIYRCAWCGQWHLGTPLAKARLEERLDA